MSWMNRIFGGDALPYTFSPPEGWKVEHYGGGTLVLCPEEEANWNANLFFEVRGDADQRALPEVLRTLIPNLEMYKGNFQLLASGVRRHAAGFDYGLIEYRHGRNDLRLLDHEILIPLGEARMLFVLTSTADEVAHKYSPIFQQVVSSIRLTNGEN